MASSKPCTIIADINISKAILRASIVRTVDLFYKLYNFVLLLRSETAGLLIDLFAIARKVKVLMAGTLRCSYSRPVIRAAVIKVLLTLNGLLLPLQFTRSDE